MRRWADYAVALLLGVSAATSCAHGPPTDRCVVDDGLDAAQKRRAEALTSLFENGTTEIQYGYAEALGDGRGLTAGRAGFTSATGDLLDVVERYVARVPDSPLAAYIPRLQELAAAESDSVEGLEGLAEAWADAADDPVFRDVQDEVVDETYYEPALAHAGDLSLCSALAVAALYDAIIQHGDGDDPDGLPALIERATDQAGGSPADGTNEEDWLSAFLDVRRGDLAHASDPDTRDVWAESVGRCDVFEQLLDDGDWDLDGPLRLHSGGYDETVD